MDCWDIAHTNIIAGNVDQAVHELSKIVKSQNVKEFMPVLDLNFDVIVNDFEQSVADFVSACRANFTVKSVYLEMNGFDINYDRWYFDYFAYDTVGQTPEDLEWLCEWQSGQWPETELVNTLESRGVFEWYHENKIYARHKEYSDLYSTCSLLVHCKFIQFVNQELGTSNKLQGVKIYSAAHGFENVGVCVP